LYLSIYQYLPQTESSLLWTCLLKETLFNKKYWNSRQYICINKKSQKAIYKTQMGDYGDYNEHYDITESMK